MNLLTIIAAVAPDAGDNAFTAVTRQFGWEPRLFLSQLVLFVIVAGVLAKFAYRPLLAMLEARRNQIEESQKNAEKTRLELANAQTKSQELLNQASLQANKIIEEARAAAAKVSEVEAQKAIATAGEIIAKAKVASEAELARMKVELRREVGRLVVATTAKVTGKILTTDDQARLAEETNKQLAA